MMEKGQFTKHISQQFNEELENVRQRVLTMGGMVEEQIERAMEALENLDPELSKEIIERDEKVNAYEVSIDEECTRILAKRQPAAGDLRLVVAIIKTITDLERIGDEAEKIARMANHIALDMDNFMPSKKQFGAVVHLGNHVRNMLNEALDAFARLDVDAALKVAHKEKTADKEYNAITRQLITYMMEDPRSISSALDVMWSARALERIGDHARNICEYVIYLVEGKDVRHVSLEEMKQLAQKK
ncbi:phosphate signaling complex protein PhoU [Pleionea litopenaei]|uniref:Phosphate-specific transport system accessory protein PhoU n=1 Tax=Pleionea litopenaei TaxID=3070815 RepID=A0AA51X813_9GAMM|nr:phosphate signaling complex protein PhoU [Pleionea sp. HL-JVS1]WMS88897.1 phosphate signaling complex protein PhoU [Pleionea sp. HL-JVS1]